MQLTLDPYLRSGEGHEVVTFAFMPQVTDAGAQS
jgi:hypothetical protein